MKSEKHHQLIAGVTGFAGQISYSPAQAAIATGRSRSRIFKALKDGELVAKKDGRATLIEAAELVRWVDAMPADGRTKKSEVRNHA
jgi:hypothetical protein